MLETKRVAAYGKRSTRIIYVSDEPRVPHGSPCISHRTSRENATSRSPISARKALGRGRKVHGQSTSPRGSPRSGNVLGIASKKPPPGSAAPTPQRRPLGLKGQPSRGSPSIVCLDQRSTQTPNTKLSRFAPFIDSDVIITDEPQPADAGRPKKRDKKGRTASSQLNRVATVVEEEAEVVRPSRKRARKRAIIVTDDDEDEDEEYTFRLTRRGTWARPIVISDESSDDYPEILPTKPAPKAHALRSTKTQTNLESKEPRPPLKTSSRRVNADVSLLTTAHKPPQPKAAHGHGLLPSAPSKLVLVRPPSPRRSQRNALGSSQNRARARSPSITDLELELELATLSLSADAHPSRQAPRPPPVPPSKKSTVTPQYLAPLLAECDQTEPHWFSTFIETFPFDDIHARNPNVEIAFRKIGEASYSEVFAIGDVVLKIVPLRDESSAVHGDDGNDADADLPQESDTKDVLQEMVVTRAMGQICPGFIKLLRTYIVLGEYPQLLLSLWDEFRNVKSSENIRPDIFPPTQAYALLVLPHGGPDLEAYTFPIKTGWHQACSIFWQTAKALATAEELVSFEHRDLHWGQILVKNATPVRKMVPRTPKQRADAATGGTGGVPMDHPSHGVTATIIDLGLARMNAGDSTGNGVHWTPFDELIFEGEGDYQFDIYRLMRRLHGDAWDQYRPLTNVMWLHYLTSKLLRSKRLRPPGARNLTVIANGFSEKQCHDCLVEVEQLLGNCIAQTKSKKGRAGGAKGLFARAGDVVYFAREKGWLE